MFLRLEGKATGLVKGESNVPEHPDEIEISAWGWGMSGANALGGGGPSARTALSEVRLHKRTDRASTQLMSVMRNNEIVKKAVLSVRKAGTTPPLDYLTITVQNGRITSFDRQPVRPAARNMVEALLDRLRRDRGRLRAASRRRGSGKPTSSFTAKRPPTDPRSPIDDRHLPPPNKPFVMVIRRRDQAAAGRRSAAKPADAKLRVFLFQLLCVQGDWSRALNQLNVACELDASTVPMVQAYRETIQCERLREQVFKGQKVPLLFGEPETWMALLIEALLREGRGDTTPTPQTLREQAFRTGARQPARSGPGRW